MVAQIVSDPGVLSIPAPSTAVSVILFPTASTGSSITALNIPTGNSITALDIPTIVEIKTINSAFEATPSTTHSVSEAIPSTTTSAIRILDIATIGPSPTSVESVPDHSSWLPSTTLVAILLPICVLFATIIPTVYLCWRRRRSNSRAAKRSERPGQHRHELEALDKDVELDGTGKQELEARVWVQELAGRTIQPNRKELETTEKAQELEARRKSQKSHRSSRSAIGDLFRRMTTRSTSRPQASASKTFEDSTPRQFARIEADIMLGMGNQSEVDDELRELRIQHGKALAEREATEQKEADLRRLIAEREGKAQEYNKAGDD